MEFLYKLYDQKYFGIVLFITIAFLLFLFLLILFFGKKDQKEKLEETKKLELAKLNTVDSVDDNTKELAVPEIEQPAIIKNNEMPSILVENSNENVDLQPKESLVDIDDLFENTNVIEKQNVDTPGEIVQDVDSIFAVDNKQEQVVSNNVVSEFEMPKLKNDNAEKKIEENNIFGDTQNNDIDNIFSNIENETYKIK